MNIDIRRIKKSPYKMVVAGEKTIGVFKYNKFYPKGTIEYEEVLNVGDGLYNHNGFKAAYSCTARISLQPRRKGIQVPDTREDKA